MMHWFRNTSDYPTFYKRYLELISDEGYSSDIISLDMETTGLNPKTADILSFGAVPIMDGKIKTAEEVHLFFNGSATAADEAVVIHELFSHTSDQLVSEMLPMLLGVIGNKTILGHFVEFDIALLNQQLKKLKLPKLKNPSLDTLTLAMKKDGIHDYSYAHKDDYTLYALCKRHDIDVEYTHDALADAYMTALLYLHLV